MWIAFSLKCPLDRVYNTNYTQSIVERERKVEGRDKRKVGGGKKVRGQNGKGRDGSREGGNEEGREERKEKGER
jgi:hypothetical protein